MTPETSRTRGHQPAAGTRTAVRQAMDPGAISEQIWDAIRAEFTLPSLEQVRVRLTGLMEDPDPVMQQLVRDLFTGLS